MKYLNFVIALTFLFAPALAGAVSLQGDYVGLISNGGANSTTTFKTEGDKITATYYMSQEKSSGTLSKIKLDKQALTGQWQDRFGKGWVFFKFNEDYSSFQGCWAKKKLKDCRGSSMLWNGTR